jgi:manganese transport protein
LEALVDRYRSVPVPERGRWLGRFLASAGPGYLISVGQMDPGNCATDITGGSRFGYALLAVILLSNLMAICCWRSRYDLELQPARSHAGLSCALFETRQYRSVDHVRGGNHCMRCRRGHWHSDRPAVAVRPSADNGRADHRTRHLTAAPYEQGFPFSLEAFVITLLVVIAACFTIQIAAAAPSVTAVLRGFVPSAQIVTNYEMLYAAIGIIGATVMPHNIYLHSSIVQTRALRAHRGRALRRDTLGYSRQHHRADARAFH